MSTTININYPAELQAGDFLVVRLRSNNKTEISGPVLLDDNLNTHIDGYGWIDEAKFEFVRATREISEPEKWPAGTIGRADVVYKRPLKAKGVIDHNGHFVWSGQPGTFTSPNGEFKNFEPIHFIDLENKERHLQTLKESISRANDNVRKLSEKKTAISNELEVLKADRDEWKAEAIRLTNERSDLLSDLNALMSLDGLNRSMGTTEGHELQKHFEQMNYEEQAVVLPTYLEIAGAVGEVLYQKNKWILGAPSKVDVGDAVLNLLKKKMTVLTVENLATFIDEVMQEESIVGDSMTIAEGVYERLGLARGTNATN